MKQIHVHVPHERVPVVVDTLDSIGQPSFSRVVGEDAFIDFTIPDNKTALIIDVLRGLGAGHVFGSIRVSPVDVELSSLASKGEKAVSTHRVKGKGVSLEEMIENIGGHVILKPNFFILSILAGFLASFGLVYDNVFIIIAAMIIDPILAPIALSVIGTMMVESPYRWKAPVAEMIALVICVAVGMIIGVLLPFQGPLPLEVRSRVVPGLADVVFAIGSGVGAGIFVIRGERTNIVGVAVAASLCPPAANIGLLLVNGMLDMAFGSFLLLILNVISIYAACAVIFWISQGMVHAGTVSSRQYKKISRRYYVQICLMIGILVAVIAGIML